MSTLAGLLSLAVFAATAAGVVWLFRLFHEPRRLGRRYLVDNPWFLYEAALQTLGLKRFEIP